MFKSIVSWTNNILSYPIKYMYRWIMKYPHHPINCIIETKPTNLGLRLVIVVSKHLARLINFHNGSRQYSTYFTFSNTHMFSNVTNANRRLTYSPARRSESEGRARWHHPRREGGACATGFLRCPLHIPL